VIITIFPASVFSMITSSISSHYLNKSTPSVPVPQSRLYFRLKMDEAN
jgi:hypothetical protein